MKKLLAAIVVVSAILAGLPTPIFARPIIRAAVPVTLIIPRLKVSAVIEPRGLNAKKIMRPPTSARTVAWFNEGTIPGQPGNAVMYGHLTDEHFRPAVFANLGKLRLNDRLIVTDARHNVHTFAVTRVKIFRNDSLTFHQLASPTDFIHLNLYTCAGHWNVRTHQYSQYAVVYTKLVSSVGGR